MFLNKSLPLKIIILLASYTLTGFIGFLFYREVISSPHILSGMGFLFGITWVSVFWGFILFQTFKGFRFPKSYYERKWFDVFKFYDAIGVSIFRLILINSFFKRLNNRVYLKKKGKKEISNFIEETKQSETSHVLAFMATAFVIVLLAVKSLYTFASILTAFNVIFNLYPVLLQRKNRFLIGMRYKSTLEEE